MLHIEKRYHHLPHDHEHEHDHDHEHNHEFIHDHAHHDHDPSHEPQRTPARELYALVKYMAGHNAAHTEELAQLAQQVHQAGDEAAYDLIMEAVEHFRHGNEHLAEALEKLPKE